MTSPGSAALRGCFVTGTDTGVGKTIVAAAVVAALARDGAHVRPFKPLITGLDDPVDPLWPPDHELLARVGGCSADEVVFAGYGPAVSPHLAAQLAEQAPPSIAELAQAVRDETERDDVAVVEGVGGLLVPLGPTGDARALAVALGLPVLIAARPGLGTINHTLLTLEAARGAGLRVAGVVLTPWPDHPGVLEVSNLETIRALGSVDVGVIPVLPGPDAVLMAAAGAALPLHRWLELDDSGRSAGATGP